MRVGTTLFPGKTRNESGTESNHNRIFCPTQPSTLSLNRKRRNSSRSQGSAYLSPNGYNSCLTCPRFVSDLRSQSLPRRRARGEPGWGTGTPTTRQWVGFPSCLTVLESLRPPFSRKQEILPIQEDHQARFYARYRKVADEYDKEFLEKCDEDLNTTLIFVSFTSSFSERVLTRVLGWSVLCCSFGLHPSGRHSTSA